MNKPTLKPYTLPSRSKSPPPEPKLVKEYVFANAEKYANKIERNGKSEESPAANIGYTSCRN